MDLRFLRHCAVLSLPPLALAAVGTVFLVFGVPRVAESEGVRAEEECKAEAEKLRTGERGPDFSWEYGKGVMPGDGVPEWAAEAFPPSMVWKDWNSRGAKRKAEMWGWRELPGLPGRVVWTRNGTRVLLALTDITRFDFTFWAWLLVPLLVASLVATSAFAAARLHEYAKIRDDFLSAAVHDLATPLVGMRYLIGSDDEEAKVLNERMIRLVDNIRDFMKAGGRRRRPEPRPMDLLSAYDKAYALFREDFRDAFDGKDVERDLSRLADGVVPEVFADEELTVQILWNLFSNELKYAAPFGPVKAVFSADGETVSVAFEDLGGGMSPREMSRAFDRYYRARTVRASGKGGFGIGLATSREFAEAMGGSLSVRANVPTGCVFTLALPRRRTGMPGGR